jgi:two-component system, chemotaxis family, protein-glutamate methylesterase/glutaminase
MIKVFVVEDSPVVQQMLIYILTSDPDISVVGTALTGQEAIDKVGQKRPDVITMDINMPNMNGFEASRRIMESTPTPIIIVSGSWEPKEMEKTFKALEAGAVAVLSKPVDFNHPDFSARAQELVQTVKLMSEVKVVKRWRGKDRVTSAAPPVPARLQVLDIGVVAIGASTGGPAVLHAIISQVPQGLQAPILVVQHISKGFVMGLAHWLGKESNVPVHVARDGDRPQRGHVYLAPDDAHMCLSGNGSIHLSDDSLMHGIRPSISRLFHSVQSAFGSRSVGVLLSGMGKDGAEELRSMKECGAITIAQSRESCVVDGMTGEAIRLNGATYILDPQEIAETLVAIVGAKG